MDLEFLIVSTAWHGDAVYCFRPHSQGLALLLLPCPKYHSLL